MEYARPRAGGAGLYGRQPLAQSRVTIITTATPAPVDVDPNQMIDELAALHGLTTPLVVSATSRAFGEVTQSIAAIEGGHTVTRQ